MESIINDKLKKGSWVTTTCYSTLWLIQIYHYDKETNFIEHMGDAYTINSSGYVHEVYGCSSENHHPWGEIKSLISKIGLIEFQSIMKKNNINRRYGKY